MDVKRSATATQNEEEGQDTPFRLPSGYIWPGAPHELPS
jgi:hypothetical protein